MVERIKENKSLVDMKLAVRICREYYKCHTFWFHQFHYWGLITEMLEFYFLVSIEYEKANSAIVEAMKVNNVA